MNLKERRQGMENLLARLEKIKREKENLDSFCAQSGYDLEQDTKDLQLLLNEEKIVNLENKIINFKLDAETWSYSIMGNKKAGILYWGFFDIIIDNMTSEEQKEGNDSRDLYRKIINNRCFEGLLEFASRQNSRLAYQVLGVLLMRYGANMPENIRELILSHSRWEDEEYQLKITSDKRNRFKFLHEFREKIRHYREGEISEASIVYLSELIEKKIISGDNSIIDKQPLDYSVPLRK